MCGSRIKNGNPVFTGRFHTDIVAALCDKPVTQGSDISNSEIFSLFTFFEKETISRPHLKSSGVR